MSKQHKAHLTLRGWFKLLFRQPPAGLYRQPSVYILGSRMEIEYFQKICTYDERCLRLKMHKGIFTIYGDRMRILTLSAHRITLEGHFLRTDFSDD